MTNMLNQPIVFQIQHTAWGTWKRHLTVAGSYFAEYESNARFLGMPLVHITRGRDPQTNRRKVARGVIAVGRIAVGIVSVGQLAVGVVPIGQLALGLLFSMGQFAIGAAALGQLAVGPLVAVGQFAVGYIAVGQMSAGFYALGQLGIGAHVWSTQIKDAAAIRFFRSLLPF
jgi:hypothetical protein